jgi:hypothetical protein
MTIIFIILLYDYVCLRSKTNAEGFLIKQNPELDRIGGLERYTGRGDAILSDQRKKPLSQTRKKLASIYDLRQRCQTRHKGATVSMPNKTKGSKNPDNPSIYKRLPQCKEPHLSLKNKNGRASNG